jgi:predicted nuclease of predicted toxin-antitoxin system
MKFKIDENLPNELAELLIHEGYNSSTVAEQNLKGTVDSELIAVCREEDRILVTLDVDFANIKTYPPQDYAGIIVLRVGRQSKSHVLDIFQKAIPLLNREPLAQHLWIVEETRVRIRGKDEEDNP